MVKDWHKVKDEIEDEIDRIWWDEPEEVTMSKLGIFPGGAGVGNQIFGNLFFQVGDTQAMGWWTVEPTMKQVLADKEFTLEHCKRVWRYSTVHMAKLMGDYDPPRTPAPWMNLGTLNRFCTDIVESLDSVKTKEELADLLWSWFNYVNRLNGWLALNFPWHLGRMFPPVTAESLAELEKVARAGTPRKSKKGPG
jgi:Cucumopine synthase C-terminal helical bundle domain